jgi:uncharacterized protein with FMN-binding domain
MDKSTLLLLAVILAVFGASVAAGHPAWGTFTGIAIILLAAGLAAGTLPLDSQAYFDERIGPSQRISNSLITLSSAAIVAIYAAGYHRTSPAAHRFDSQNSQNASTTIAAVVPPATGHPATNTPASPAATPPVKKNNPRPPAAPRKTPAGNSPATTTGANPSAGAEAAPAAHAAPAAPRYKDGMYLAWGSCPHGDIEVSVSIEGGKIAFTAISQCLTRYSCGWIAPKIPGGGLPDLPSQVVERQSPKVDYVSGATESSYAFADAIAAALSKALQ